MGRSNSGYRKFKDAIRRVCQPGDPPVTLPGGQNKAKGPDTTSALPHESLRYPGFCAPRTRLGAGGHPGPGDLGLSQLC